MARCRSVALKSLPKPPGNGPCVPRAGIHAAAGSWTDAQILKPVGWPISNRPAQRWRKIEQVETPAIRQPERLCHKDPPRSVSWAQGLGFSLHPIRGTNRVQCAAGVVRRRLLECALLQRSLPRGQTDKGGVSILAGHAGGWGSVCRARHNPCWRGRPEWTRTSRRTGFPVAQDFGRFSTVYRTLRVPNGSPAFAWQVEPAQRRIPTGPSWDLGVPETRAPASYLGRRAWLPHTIVRPSRAASTRRRAPACRTKARACSVRAAMWASS